MVAAQQSSTVVTPQVSPRQYIVAPDPSLGFARTLGIGVIS